MQARHDASPMPFSFLRWPDGKEEKLRQTLHYLGGFLHTARTIFDDYFKHGLESCSLGSIELGLEPGRFQIGLLATIHCEDPCPPRRFCADPLGYERQNCEIPSAAAEANIEYGGNIEIQR